MIFSRRVNICIGIVLLLCIMVCIVGMIDVNKRFPQVKEVYGAKGESVSFNGLDIRGIECKVYTVEEFCNTYPKVMYYKYLLNDKNMQDISQYRIVYYKIEVTNNTSENRKYNAMEAIAASTPHCWNNGMPPWPGTNVVKAGETVEFESAALITPSLAGYKDYSEMAKEEYFIILRGYPEKIMVKFYD